MHQRLNSYQTKVNPSKKARKEEEGKRTTENLLKKFFQALGVDLGQEPPLTLVRVTNQCRAS